MADYTLIGDYGPQDNVLAIAPPYVLPGAGYPALMQIEDENILVRGGAGTALISVDRGVDGTDKAAHASGVTLADIPPPTSTPSGGVIPATVTLSSADILDLHNTPITLVAAPGAGKMLMPHRYLVVMTFGTAAYANADGWPSLRWQAGATTIVDLDILAAPATRWQHGAAPDMAENGLSDFVNDPLVVSVGDVITDGDGTLTVTVYYTIEDVPA